MKELLNTQMTVRCRNDDGTDGTTTKSIRELIQNPEGIHFDDALNAVRIFCAQIIVEFDADEAAE